MQFLWQRYSRSGTAPPWFYWLIGAGFAALAAFAIARGSWIVAALAIVMIAVTAAGATVLRRATTGTETSRAESAQQEDDDER